MPNVAPVLEESKECYVNREKLLGKARGGLGAYIQGAMRIFKSKPLSSRVQNRHLKQQLQDILVYTEM